MSPNQTRPSNCELIFQLVEAARHVRNRIEQIARSKGTTRAQWGLLARLRRMDGAGPSQIDLAADMEKTPIAVARLVDRMEEQGLIERRAYEHDRRINRLYLTGAGRKAVDGLDTMRATVAEQTLDGVSAAEVAITLSVINRIAANTRCARRSADDAGVQKESLAS